MELGLVQVLVALIIIGGALYLLPRATLDAGMVTVIKVILWVVALIILLLFVVRILEEGTIPLR